VEAVTLGLPVTVGTTAALEGAVVGAEVVVRLGVGAADVGAAVVGATVGVGVVRTVSGAHAGPAIKVNVNIAMSTRSLTSSPYRIRTGGLCLERAVSWAARRTGRRLPLYRA